MYYALHSFIFLRLPHFLSFPPLFLLPFPLGFFFIFSFSSLFFPPLFLSFFPSFHVLLPSVPFSFSLPSSSVHDFPSSVSILFSLYYFCSISLLLVFVLSLNSCCLHRRSYVILALWCKCYQRIVLKMYGPGSRFDILVASGIWRRVDGGVQAFIIGAVRHREWI